MNNAATLYQENDHSFNLYLKEIAKFKPLRRGEERDIIIKVKKGDKKAMAYLIKANLRFVVSVSANYRNQGIPLGDIVNEGNMGLIRAARRFDETKGYKFISYAVWWIRQAILQAMSEQSRIVRMPLNRVSTIFQVGKMASRLEQELKRPPSWKEIAKKLKISEANVSEAIGIGNTHSSLDMPSDDGGGNLFDLISDESAIKPDSAIDNYFLNNEINELLNTLKHREANVLRLYYGIDCDKPHTLEEIALKYGLTRERIRQIKERALTRLKHPSRNFKLKEFYTE